MLIPRNRTGILSALCLLLAVGLHTYAAEPLAFSVQLSPEIAEEPVTGRLLVFLTQRSMGEPRMGPNWFRPEPFFAIDVKNVRPGESRTIDDRADAFPEKLSKLPAGSYRIQAVLHHNLDSPKPGQGPGNFYSDVTATRLDGAASGSIELVLTRTVPRRPFPESDRVKEVALRSKMLSKFHRRDVIQRAAVILPESYAENPERRYPVIYSIPGFGGNHFPKSSSPRESGVEGVEFIRVMLDPQCQWGHHVFANSATNGPRGDALIEELIPHIDAKYRTVAAQRSGRITAARFLTGHSSGGWSSLWLQVSYPDTFGGVWSISPDPVDFRDFQQVDLYADPPLSLYRDAQGDRRPIARFGETPMLWYETFGQMDDCLGRGGQLRSFEAVFSPLGPNGLPRKLWDRQTGRIDPAAAKAWRQYDIGLLLEENWKTLGPKLRGKIHIATGTLDTFYLEGAVELLAETLERLESDAEIEIVPGRDHSNILFPNRNETNRRQMAEAFLKHHPAP